MNSHSFTSCATPGFSQVLSRPLLGPATFFMGSLPRGRLLHTPPQNPCHLSRWNWVVSCPVTLMRKPRTWATSICCAKSPNALCGAKPWMRDKPAPPPLWSSPVPQWLRLVALIVLPFYHCFPCLCPNLCATLHNAIYKCLFLTEVNETMKLLLITCIPVLRFYLDCINNRWWLVRASIVFTASQRFIYFILLRIYDSNHLG